MSSRLSWYTVANMQAILKKELINIAIHQWSSGLGAYVLLNLLRHQHPFVSRPLLPRCDSVTNQKLTYCNLPPNFVISLHYTADFERHVYLR